MELKVGDKVRVKSLEWYNKNEDGGIVTFENSACFTNAMSKFCGMEAIIKRVVVSGYVLDIDEGYYFSEYSIEPIIQDNSLNVLKGCTLTTNCITLQDGQTAKICTENGKTKIMIENKEVKEEEPKFKKGDVVFLEVQGDNKIYQHIIITKSIYGNRHHFYADFCINENELYYGYESMWFSKENIKSIRYATVEEKRTLFLAMLNQGLFLDENKMKVRTLKDGDIITIQDIFNCSWYSIFKEIKDEKIWSYADLELRNNNLYNEGSLCFLKSTLSISYSTTEERQTLFDKIEEQKHQKWNAETKDFDNVRWRAKSGETYWYVSKCLNVEKCIEHGYIKDIVLGKVNNKFQTKELAEAAANKIKELLSKL